MSELAVLEHSLHNYVIKVNRFPILKPEDERDLIDQWDRFRCVKAIQKLIMAHLRLVVKIANDFRFYGIPMMDLIQEGNFGLMTAAKKFDSTKECRFSTYSMLWIKANIQNFILNSWSLVKINTTNSKRKLFFGLKKILKALDIEDLNFFEKTDRIAQQMTMPSEDVRDVYNVMMGSHKFLSDKIVNQDDNQDNEFGNSLSDRTESQELIVIANDLYVKQRKIFNDALNNLAERERNILLQRNGETKKTLDELSKEYNVSKERIRQIASHAMKKMQNFCQQY